MGNRTAVQGMTVDPAWARELDDAIWVDRLPRGYRATVSIADVAGMVPAGSIDDMIAAARGLSCGAGASAEPGARKEGMLIPQIARGAASLLPGRSRSVVAHITEFSLDGAPLSHRLARASFRSRAKLSHEDFESIFLGDDALSPTVRDAVTLASLLWRRRVASAGLPDWESAFDADGHLREGCPAGLLAQSVVHEFMVAANTCATRVVRLARMPMIYRNQGPREGGPVGRYETACHGHDRLGEPAYGQFTSPIRRYTDLVNQRIACAAAERADAPYDEVSLAPVCAEGNRAVQAAEAEARPRGLAGHPGPGRAADPPLPCLDSIAFRWAARRSGTLAPETACGREVQRRARDGLLTHDDVAWLLFACADIAPAEVRAGILHRLTANPAEMARIWRCGTASHCLPPYDAWTRPAGGDWVASAISGGHAGEARDRDPVRARGLALIRLAAAATGVGLPAHLQEGKGLVLADALAKARLVSLCRFMGWGGPDFLIVDRSAGGPPHFGGHVEVAAETFGYRSPVVHASSLRSASAAASALALAALNPYADCLLQDNLRRYGPDISILEGEHTVQRPLAALADFCRHNGAAHRCVWFAEMASSKRFECALEVSAGGNTLRALGAGAHRMEAMETAARDLAGALLGYGGPRASGVARELQKEITRPAEMCMAM